MTPEQIQELIDRLFGMGETMATEGFRLALLQVQVNFWLAISWIILAILFLVGGFFITKYAMKETEEDDDSSWFIWVLVYIFIGLFAIIAILVNINTAIALGINPEWYAIKEIMSLLP